ncbi:MAG: tRNA-dihydrouridine synthase family protein [Bacteroidales bacterium]|nr:tRNA-dihydrouridine synthase family protein [Bacteroidales bacterium]
MPIYLAPIQGFTDYVFRNAHSSIYGGVSKYFTPFIRVESGAIRKKDITDLINSREFDIPDNELVPQVIANSREDIKLLLDFVQESGFAVCDINFGCPFPQQSKKYRGCGILQSPEKVAEVLGTLKEYSGMEFSLKMRLGYNSPEESLAVADIINDTPLRFVTIHPRLGKQMYTGKVDMEGFEKLANSIKHPIVYNGDIRSEDQISDLQNKYPNLHAVMIGRGLIANPGLAENFVNGQSSFSREKFIKFLNLLIEGYSSQYGHSDFMVLDKMKTFFTYSDFDKKNLKKIQKSRSISELITNVVISI